VAEQITIRQILNHSSGLGDIFTEDYMNSSKSLYRNPRDFFPLFADEPLMFTPGEEQSYSNAGYMVLGAIIAELSGESYYDYVQQHIFDRADMDHTGFFDRDQPVKNVAMGYTKHGSEDDEWRSNVFHLPARGNSAGSAQTTAADMLKFDNAVREYKLLPPDYTQWYFGDAEPSGGDSPIKKNAPRATSGTGIAGGGPGVSAVLDGDGRLAVILLSNYDAPITESVSRVISRPLKRALKNLDGS
jgi:D-alanyl-D-alanine carboxypeptidase